MLFGSLLWGLVTLWIAEVYQGQSSGREDFRSGRGATLCLASFPFSFASFAVKSFNRKSKTLSKVRKGPRQGRQENPTSYGLRLELFDSL
jgi:hypothetical protein